MPRLASRAPQGAPYEALVEAGWAAMDRRDTTTSIAMFQRALELNANGTDASYGLGYALLQSGRPNGAARYLCRALVRAEGPTRTEITGLLSREKLVCP